MASGENAPIGVWIDQDLCTGDGLCAEIAPDVFVMEPDGLAYVKEGDKIFAAARGNPEGAAGVARFAIELTDDVVEAAEECPGECIFFTPLDEIE
jgi:ferredoxin